MANERIFSRDEIFLKKLREAVLSNLENEQFGVTELSEAVAISRFHLHRKLKSLQGKSVSQFIREVRLEEAMKMLRADTATAAEIAYKVGFSSPSYFSKCFQSYFGYPPGEAKKIVGEKIRDTPLEPVVQNEMVDRQNVNPEKSTKTNTGFPVKIVLTLAAIIIVGLLFYYYSVTRNQSPSNLEKSIAVLPFTNLSSNPDNQHFADGLVEDLLNRLSVIEEFKVISRTSSEMYREKGTKSVPQIADELDVAYIVEGSVQRQGNKARINIQLIDAHKDDHVWSENFDRDINDIFLTQSEIATHIAKQLNQILTSEQTLDIQKNKTTSFEAFELYHLGRFYWNKRTGDGYRTSISYFENAIKEDPHYGLAYSGLADTYHLMALQGHIDRKEGRDKAVALALQALRLDENLAEAHNVLASVYCYFDWDWQSAEKEFRQAIKVNPNYSTVHHYYSEYLSMVGRHDEARIHINKALELDPLSFVIRWVSTKLYYHQGNFNEALVDNLRSQELQKDHPWSLWYSVMICRQLGMHDKALSAFLTLYTENDHYDPQELKNIYSTSGIDGLIRWSLDKNFKHEDGAGYGSAYSMANKYGMLGDTGNAMQWLEKSFNDNTIDPEFSFNIHFKALHDQPGYKAILEKMGLRGS
jgi:TolB-like protein/AraC-like DNA-binding protein